MVNHGVEWTYQQGCRCVECVREHNYRSRGYMNKWYELHRREKSKIEHNQKGTCRWCT